MAASRRLATGAAGRPWRRAQNLRRRHFAGLAMEHASGQRYRHFADFYPFYLGEHANRTSRRLHFTGISVGLLLLVAAIATGRWWLIALGLAQGYAFAWVGHFFFERNRPATFNYPLFSLLGDWRLWWDIVRGKIAF